MQRSTCRQPWAPVIPSTLGTSRPAVYQMAQSGAVKSDDGGSEQGIDIDSDAAYLSFVLGTLEVEVVQLSASPFSCKHQANFRQEQFSELK
jgi:hypothetical protein